MLASYITSHLFLPGYSNNQKAKILHNTSIFVFLAILVVYQILLQLISSTGSKILGYASNISINDVVNITNQKRQENGVEPLILNETLSSAAHSKGLDMLEHDYWAHVSPQGTEPWKFFTDSGYTYKYAGENLARDFSNPSSAVDAWMASPSHRDNMLSGKYKEIGVAVVEGDLSGVETTLIVQMFGTKYTDTLPSVPIASAKTNEVNQEKLVPTNKPTLIPTPTAVPYLAVSDISQTNSAGVSGSRIMISPFNTTRNLSLVTVLLLLTVLFVDAYVTRKRNIPRFGGRVFAHLAFLGMILAIVLIAKAGAIL